MDSPDPHIFEQAIFIVRNDAFRKEGVTPEQVVNEACRVARGCTDDAGRRPWRRLPPLCWSAMGAGFIGLLWLLAALL